MSMTLAGKPYLQRGPESHEKHQTYALFQIAAGENSDQVYECWAKKPMLTSRFHSVEICEYEVRLACVITTPNTH